MLTCGYVCPEHGFRTDHGKVRSSDEIECAESGCSQLTHSVKGNIDGGALDGKSVYFKIQYETAGGSEEIANLTATDEYNAYDKVMDSTDAEKITGMMIYNSEVSLKNAPENPFP
mgnify:CR=1 FL=1